jgi:hypothetical protein
MSERFKVKDQEENYFITMNVLDCKTRVANARHIGDPTIRIKFNSKDFGSVINWFNSQ